MIPNIDDGTPTENHDQPQDKQRPLPYSSCMFRDTLQEQCGLVGVYRHHPANRSEWPGPAWLGDLAWPRPDWSSGLGVHLFVCVGLGGQGLTGLLRSVMPCPTWSSGYAWPGSAWSV